MRSFVSITILSLLYGVHTAPLSSRPSIRASSVVTRSPEVRPELLKFRRLAARRPQGAFDEFDDPFGVAKQSGAAAQTGDDDFEGTNVNDVTIENGVVTSGSGVVNGQAVKAGDVLPPLDDETEDVEDPVATANESGAAAQTDDEDFEADGTNVNDVTIENGIVTSGSGVVNGEAVSAGDEIGEVEDTEDGEINNGQPGSADAGDAEDTEVAGGAGDDGLNGGAGEDTLETGNDSGLGLINVGLSSATPRSSVNAATLNMVKSFEGFEPSPKKDPVGLFTVGFGHKCLDQSNAKCAEVPFTFPMSRADADQLLLSDMQEGVVCVNQNVKVALNENQFGALASFAFNGGCGLLRSSTLLKRLNAGENPNTVAAAELPKFNKGTDPNTGQKFVLNGLTRRRAAEVALFTS